MYQSNRAVPTAVTIIEGFGIDGMIVTGYNTGDIVLTNRTPTSSSQKSKTKRISRKYLLPHAVTAITATSVDANKARVIIGFSDASILIIDVFVRGDGTPTNGKNRLIITQSTERNTPIRAITILSNTSIAIVLGDNKIKIINFHPTLLACRENQQVSLLYKNASPMLPLARQNTAAAMLPIQKPSDPIMYYVYALDTSNQLFLCKYDQDFNYLGMGSAIIHANVREIATPTRGSGFILFSTTDDLMYKAFPCEHNLFLHQIDVSIPSTSIYAMAHTASALYIETTTGLFKTLFPQPDSSISDNDQHTGYEMGLLFPDGAAAAGGGNGGLPTDVG